MGHLVYQCIVQRIVESTAHQDIQLHVLGASKNVVFGSERRRLNYLDDVGSNRRSWTWTKCIE